MKPISSRIKNFKSELRRELRRSVRALEEPSRRKKSGKIAAALIKTSAFRKARSIMAYVAAPGEVDTAELILKALALNKKVYVPRVDPGRKQIRAVRIRNLNSDLKAGFRGIREPKSGRGVSPAALDLVIVPGVGFSRRGARLGRGGGYYDRFLKRTKAFKVGLAFKEQLHSRIPMETNDVRLDRIITD